MDSNDHGEIVIYTNKLRREVRKIKPPHGFVVDIIEYDLSKPHFISLRFYYEQWTHYTEKERYDCYNYLLKVKSILTAHNIPVTLEPTIGFDSRPNG